LVLVVLKNLPVLLVILLAQVQYRPVVAEPEPVGVPAAVVVQFRHRLVVVPAGPEVVMLRLLKEQVVQGVTVARAVLELLEAQERVVGAVVQ
jgi:hypothetical protein